MVGYITTDDLWRKWARDRGLTAPTTTDIDILARDYYQAADVDTAASVTLNELLASGDAGWDAVASATERANRARGQLLLVEDAIEAAGGWVDPYRSDTVVIDVCGRPVSRVERPAVELVPSPARPARTQPASRPARPLSAVGW